MDIVAMIGDLSAEKRLLFELLRRRKAGDPGPGQSPPAGSRGDRGPFSLVSAADRAILPPDLEDAYPLASMQLGMLYHTELTRDEELPAYHNVFLFDIDSAIDPGRFAAAIHQVVARHPILRTSFDLQRFSEPLQLIHRRAHLLVPCIDLAGLDNAAQERELDRFVRLERRRVLDPSRPPLLRFFLHRLSESRFRVTMTESHTIAEGWGTYQTLGEIQELYFSLLRGEHVPDDKPLALTYREFIRLEREALASGECRRYWEETLAGGHAVRAPRWPGWSGESASEERTHIFRIPEPVLQALRDLSRRLEVPLKSVLLTAHLKVLSLLSGERDLIVALHVHGRPEEVGGEYVRGVFNNTVPLRVDLAPGSWADLIRRVFAAELALIPFQRYPAAAIQRDTGMMSQLEIQIGYVNFHLFGEFRTSDRVTAPGGIDRSLTHYPLALYFWAWGPGPARLDLRCERFDPVVSKAQILALRGYYEEVLQAMIGEPGAAHDARSWLSPAERHQILLEYNDTAVEFSRELCLHRLIERQVALTPGALAIACEDSSLTYRELDARAGHLARRLRRLGVGSDAVVGICAERSLELMVGLLGILKAGGAYLPLDPSYPPERLTFMVEDGLKGGERPVLLAQKRWSPLFADCSSRAGARVIPLEEAWETAGEEDEDGEEKTVDPSSLAYVIYTSGSTGRPKGVMSTHGGISNRLLWMQATYGLEADDRVLQKTPLSFDVSVWELFSPLITGARLVLARPGGHRDSSYLVDLIEKQGITTLHFVPSMLSAFLEEPDLHRCASLRRVIASGEVLPAELARRFSARLGAELHNLYGPTEAAVEVTSHAYRGESPDTSVPIGRPISNLGIWLLDSSLQPVPLGVPGELYIGGAGLARGYLGRPDLTADRFLPHPEARRPGERLYRTGDLARFRLDGEIAFLGRTDHQVKLRGFRIELGEIEEVLAQHPAVREAVTVAREERPGEVRLVVYAVPSQEPAPEVSELRAWLAARLPEFMLPSAYVLLQALPLTPNGKVNRKALPAPEWRGEEKACQAPRTPVEEVLAGIWAELLDLERVGMADNFFDLGGHSLLAMRVISRLRGAFGVELPLRDLFEAPVLADLAARVETASRAGTGRLTPPLVPAPREGPLPLSFAQQRLWFIDQVQPDSPLYNIAVALHAEGRLDTAVLARCLGEIVRRHEALRTVFAEPQGAPVQVIQPAGPFPLPVVDLSALPESVREDLARTLAAAEAGRPFDLARGPLLRGSLVRLAENDHAVLLTLHHIVSDGWSMGLLVREIAALYPAFVAGRPSPLPGLPVQYADFAVWQRSWLEGEVLEGEIAFWREQLAGLPPLLELPTDRPRPAVLSYRGATRPVRLPAELVRQAEALGRREGATLFMVLLAAFQALLARHSGQDDFAVGSPVAGRNRVETEELIGFFVNTLALRAGLTGARAFRDLLSRVRATTLAAWLHQDVPFEKLVEELTGERNLSHAPLFQVVLALQNAPFGRLEIQDLRLESVPVAGTTAKFDLTVNVAEHGGALEGGVEYATDLYDAATVDRLMAGFERLLAAAVDEPELRVTELPLLSPSERHQVLTEWNDTGGERSWESPVTFLVERWCLEQPDAPAVVDAAGRALTYGEFGERSGRLAGFLRALGVGQGSIVAVLMEPSVELPVAQLGSLKAGAAYLSLDPAHPAERLAFMLEESAAPVVLTQESLLPRLAGGLPGARIVCLDRDRWEVEVHPAAPPTAVEPDDLAYVLYTSGSTGRPKGVQIPHRGLINLVRWELRTGGEGPGDRVSQVTSLGFDVSVMEIWTCLASGAALHLPPQEARLDPPWLAAWMAERGITVSFLATPLAEALLAAGGPRVPGLRRLVVGGDRLLLNPEPGCGFDLINIYGPAEASVVISASTVPPRRRGEAGPSPSIGRPLDGLRIYLLDRSLQPVPPGVAGDLWVGGPALARGYLGDPARTAERFQPDPWGNGERLYRTGDLCRYRRDGEIEYIGRTDFQVKIRGQRVELGEIEALLLEMPGVREAVVVAREDHSGERRLIAYMVEDVAADELRLSLRERVPAAMVPAAFVPLAAFPLTPNGKVDRKALPAPEWQDTEKSYVAPRTPVEDVLAGLWAEVLGLARVGAEDRFFDLGGHSLLATRVRSRVREALGVELPLRTIFERPRLADLAAEIEALKPAADAPQRMAIERADRRGPLPLSWNQQRFWFLHQLNPDSSAFNLSGAVRLSGRLDGAALEASFGEVARRHSTVRTRIVTVAGVPHQIVDPPGNFVLPRIDLSVLGAGARDHELRRVAESAANRPFDLATEPPLQILLLRLADDDHALLFSLHHIVGDGWSMDILTRELGDFYAAFSEGRPSPLPELPIQYADWIVAQQEWLHGPGGAEQLAYWHRKLRGDLPVLTLPMQRQRSSVRRFLGSSQPLSLGSPLSAALADLARSTGSTLFMGLLAAFKALLHQVTGAEDLLVGTNVANREWPGTQGLIGLFVNDLALRTDLSGRPSFRELLARVRETALEAYAHQDLPFEALQADLRPERSAGPLFQVLFTLQNAPAGVRELPGLILAPLPAERRTANFDLSLSMIEGANGLNGAFVYDIDLFEASSIAHLAEHFAVLLREVVSDPDRPLSSLSFTSSAAVREMAAAFSKDL